MCKSPFSIRCALDRDSNEIDESESELDIQGRCPNTIAIITLMNFSIFPFLIVFLRAKSDPIDRWKRSIISAFLR
jgi:hypothetical protein